MYKGIQETNPQKKRAQTFTKERDPREGIIIFKLPYYVQKLQKTVGLYSSCGLSQNDWTDCLLSLMYPVLSLQLSTQLWSGIFLNLKAPSI